jgi:hypothetical protein
MDRQRPSRPPAFGRCLAAALALALASPLGAQTDPAQPAAADPAADAVTAASVEAAPADPAAAEPATTDAAAVDAVSGATPGGGFIIEPSFFGLPVPTNVHKATGYAAGGLFAAAGLVGLARFLDLEARSHQYRTGEEFTAACPSIIAGQWASGQQLRWVHVSLLSAGEALYLFDAATGISLIPPDGGGAPVGKLHRAAFFAHAGLMLAEIILGFMETDALSRGDHGRLVGYGALHAGIGVAIPALILGSGALVDFYPDLLK